MKNISKLSSDNLLKKFSVVVSREREVIVDVIIHLSEIAKRKLHAREGFSNIHAYLQKTFLYSGGATYRRMQAVKLSARFPEVLAYLSQGKLNLTSICLIEPHVTFSNGKRIIEQVLGKTKQEIEVFLADTFQVKPKQMQDKMRQLPVIKKRVPVQECHSERETRRISNSAAENSTENSHVEKIDGRTSKENMRYQTVEIRRVKVEFVVDEKVAKKIERAKEVLRHKFPEGKLEDIIDQALEDLLEKRDVVRKVRRMAEKQKVQRVEQKVSKTPVNGKSKQIETRYIPASIRRLVWQRDTGQCSYKSPNGQLCGERSFLQIDHIKPWALNGKHKLENLRLLCSPHNRYRAEQTFGFDYRSGDTA